MNIGGTEVFLILVVALLLFGAKNLPKIARGLGKSVEEFRRAAREVSREVMTADQVDEPPPQPKQITGGEQIAHDPSGEPVIEPATVPTTEPGSEPPSESAPAPTGADGQIAQKGSSDDEGRG
jgi:sec-independent protein translocase protein TatA